MEICLYKSIVEYQNGNNEHVEELIEKFSPLLKKYAYKLKYEDALSDLILIFIETLNKIPMERFTKMIKEQYLTIFLIVFIMLIFR